jgi:hypothetical protein
MVRRTHSGAAGVGAYGMDTTSPKQTTTTLPISPTLTLVSNLTLFKAQGALWIGRVLYVA